MQVTHNILLLDGDEQSALDIQRFLKASSYAFNLNHASDIPEGANFLSRHRPDLILLDADMVDKNEFQSFRQVAARADIPVILLSDMGNDETRQQAERAGANDYLVKNKINLFHLQKAILNTLRINETEAKLGNTLNQFNARHDAFYQVLNKINSAVLVINSSNAIVYSNAKAYSILSDENIRELISGHLVFQDLDEEEWIEMKPKKKILLGIRISNMEWNNEKANLFLIDKTIIEEDSSANILSDKTLPLLLNSIKGNILLLKDRQVIFASKSALKLANFKPVEILQKPLNNIVEANEPANQQVSIANLFNEKESDGMLRNSDGSMQKIKLFIKPLNISDEFYELLSFEIFSEPAERTQPKARSDEERFSTDSILHLASHDLREPVRTILNYVQLISDNLANKRYEAATEYADIARDAASGMDKLLSDLKVYIGLADYKFTLSKISMKTTAADALKQLKKRIEETGAEVNVADLPDLNADRELVEKLIFHLVDNAIKFRKKGKTPVVDIGFDKFEGNVIFCVRDNGIGISKRYYQHIFEAFERLNRVDEYPGNGLGLAICKKVVEMHGGEIWVESLPGSGSNFYFTLRSKQPNE